MADEDVEVVVKPKAKKKGGSLKTVVISCVMLIVGSLSVLLFLLIAEPLQPPKERDTERPRVPIEELPLDLRLHDRYMIKTELDSLLAQTFEQRDSSHSSVVTIYDAGSVISHGTNDFNVYLQEAPDDIHARMRVGCTLAARTDADELVVDVDGSVYEVPIGPGDMTATRLPGSGSTHECVEITGDDHVDMIGHIGNAKDVHITFKGPRTTHTVKLTKSQIASTAKMMRIYRLRHILLRDARETAALALAEAQKDKDKK